MWALDHRKPSVPFQGIWILSWRSLTEEPLNVLEKEDNKYLLDKGMTALVRHHSLAWVTLGKSYVGCWVAPILWGQSVPWSNHLSVRFSLLKRPPPQKKQKTTWSGWEVCSAFWNSFLPHPWLWHLYRNSTVCTALVRILYYSGFSRERKIYI